MSAQNPIPPSATPPPFEPEAQQHRRARRAVVIFLVCVLTIALLIFLNFLRPSRLSKRSAVDLLGRPAPDFELKDLSGKTVHLSDFRGKAVVLDFWATWCPPCLREIPIFVEMQREYGPQGLEIVGIAMDDDATPASIGSFAQRQQINYTVLLGRESVADAYGGIDALPTTFYIDRYGRVVERAFGAGVRSEIEDKVKKVLASSGPAAGDGTPATAGAATRQLEHGASN